MTKPLSDNDLLWRFLFQDAPVRGEAVHMESSWQIILERGQYPAAVRSLLGELLAAATLLTATLKLEGSIIIQAQGHGPVSFLVVECTSDRRHRAMAKWDQQTEGLDKPHRDIRKLLGDGRLIITIDQKNLKQRYQGIVELNGHSVAQILEHYLEKSEQLGTRLWLSADEHCAAGLLLQQLPAEHHAEIDDDAWNRAVKLALTVTKEELLEVDSRTLIHRLYHEENLRLFDPDPVSFHCPCSRERVANAIRTLGYDDVHNLLLERGNIESHCEFCNARYEFDAVDVEQIFAADHMNSPRPTRH
ncbi:MAG: Hsp33 family molecular chaperone HslO [Gammaproteobacteria bacterium]|nr:Hsp33 family molecular chaperone HslO [Gammaproteobacteria bacterium]